MANLNWNDEIMAIESNGCNHYLTWIDENGEEQEVDGMDLVTKELLKTELLQRGYEIMTDI